MIFRIFLATETEQNLILYQISSYSAPKNDKRSAWLKWKPVDNAYAYNIYTGIAPDKLYNCIMVHNANDYWYKGMDKNMPYYFCIEAINENGVSAKTAIMKAE
ncbi:fibronectin type III domain-containing protein [Pseudarcicella hirudinis]|uniref:fibronectin type III domain-containing protein n=1 Tax=Pseudarcicella hirudinis TaxID=1079859 RepID=UPI0035ED3E1C